MRFISTQPIVMIYDAINAVTVTDTIAFNATVEPMLMSDSKIVIIKDRKTALIGIFQPFGTYD